MEPTSAAQSGAGASDATGPVASVLLLSLADDMSQATPPAVLFRKSSMREDPVERRGTRSNGPSAGQNSRIQVHACFLASTAVQTASIVS